MVDRGSNRLSLLSAHRFDLGGEVPLGRVWSRGEHSRLSVQRPAGGLLAVGAPRPARCSRGSVRVESAALQTAGDANLLEVTPDNPFRTAGTESNRAGPTIRVNAIA